MPGKGDDLPAQLAQELNITPEQLATGDLPADVQAKLMQKVQELGLTGLPTHDPEEFLASLPPEVAARARKVGDLHEKYEDLHTEFKKELKALEAKYRTMYEPLWQERAEYVKGEKEAESVEGAETKGIPEFWLTVFKNNEVLEESVSEKDEAVLAYLQDITSSELEEEGKQGFTLNFEFAENPFFSNKTLTKTYHLVEDEETILEHCEGCPIDWKTGKNVTVKVMKKKVKPGKATKGPMMKTEKIDSFFNFFDPPAVPEDNGGMSEEEMDDLQEVLEGDYELGSTILNKIIPQAYGWYTGELCEPGFALGDLDGDEDDEDDDSEDDDDEDGPTKAPVDAKEPECKQQ